jgi:hypothetical protein
MVWREFSRKNCELYGVLELIPDPVRQIRSSVVCFDERPTPRR